MSFYSIKVDQPVSLSKTPTSYNTNLDKKELKDILKQLRKQIALIQEKLYAHNKYAVLICLQGMDTAGKDSLIREVFKNVNVSGIRVTSFKKPSKKEHEHDFLWRHYRALPEKGCFGIFNRTHYENVLITKVHPTYLLLERLPDVNQPEDATQEFWNNRYKSIVNFEEHLMCNGTIVLKFFLHLSKEEQKNRLLRRLNLPEKNWKFEAGDIEERKRWNDYQIAYENAIQKTSTSNVPWYIIPADNKHCARIAVANTIIEVLSKYNDIDFPESKFSANDIVEFKTQL